ncbi:hypothetical protein [Lutispora sp.]|uniref:hypothetical protein n=1 Tax=Lutispora sp. TaxID=2828727 RepID=UPI002B204F19|nr:hypothetical protein [Lutispora sp.]MEA4963810.1 hypothetical protein [Lutispora sp.]
MAKGSNNNLPAYTTVENLFNLINVLKKNNKNEESIKALFGLGDSAYRNTKSALKAFGIIENDSLDFTDIGREIAYSGEDNKKEEMTRIVKCYEPYELVLNSIVTSRTDTKVTEIDTIKNLWGRADFGSGDRNRNDGATLFMSVIDYIGFAKYVIGRGSNPTRIEWAPDIKNKINSLNQDSPIVEQEENTNSNGKDTIEASIVDTATVEEEQEENSSTVNIVDERNVKPIEKPVSAVSLPNVTINVDMSDWSDEKIKTFFKYAYGKFEED